MELDRTQKNKEKTLMRSEEITVYPHQALAFLSIAKLWAVSGLMVAGIFTSLPHLPPNLILPAKGLGIFLILSSILFAFHQLMHYSHTHLKITKEALVYKRGWIPSTTDNMFWVNIKDINTESSVTESLLNSGTIIIIVAIRTAIYQVKIGYLPNHEEIAANIRTQIGILNEGARQVTYT